MTDRTCKNCYFGDPYTASIQRQCIRCSGFGKWLPRPIETKRVIINGETFTVPQPVADELERLREQLQDYMPDDSVYRENYCTCPQTDREGEKACPVCKADNGQRYVDEIPVEGMEE
jgi:hypothetical protein